MINKVKNALKVFVLMFLFKISNFFMPENSILIKCNPITPKIKGKKKLIEFGKNDVMLILKKEFKNTSNKAIKNNNDPAYKYVFKFSLPGFKILILFIIFL